jgi:hypothetical protein
VCPVTGSGAGISSVGSVHGVADGDGDVIIDVRYASKNRLHLERQKAWRRRLQLDQCILGVLGLGFFSRPGPWLLSRVLALVGRGRNQRRVLGEVGGCGLSRSCRSADHPVTWPSHDDREAMTGQNECDVQRLI